MISVVAACGVENSEASPSEGAESSVNNMSDLEAVARNIADVIVPFMEENYSASTEVNDRAVFGLSAGGSMATTLMQTIPEEFAYIGISSVGRSFPLSNATADLDDIKNTVISVYCGNLDYREPASYTIYEEVAALGGSASFKVMSGAHDWSVWSSAVNDFLTNVAWQDEDTTSAVDTSALTAAIEQAEALTESDYTSSTWAALETALESAKTVAANADATQDEVDEATSALTAAIDALAAATKVTVPSATKITSAVNRASGIKLSWNSVSTATSYQVYRKIGSGSWKKVKTTSSTSWTDTAATKNGTKYQYKVYAVNSAGKSKASAAKTIYRLTAKHFTRAKNVSGKKISLKWTRNTKATGYQIQYSTSSSFSSSTTKTVTIKGNKNLTTTLKNLTKGKKYYIRMRAYKTSGSVTSYAGWSKVKTVTVKK
ncbi:MAG: fibronectin type III domain-containing protein [Clostridiales bacterium]|nr:fibronectin type III domain-containing protein [Clostridiales bacterium]